MLRLDVNDNGIATLWLDGGGRPVVILDRNLIHRLNTTLDAIEQQTSITGLVLRSDCDRVFVAGADLAEIDALDDHGLHAYLAFGTTVFGRLCTLPYPTVACINGAALGGGLEIAMHCDAMIASVITCQGKEFSMGLPEASLGLCPGWGGSQMLPARIDPKVAMKATATGKLFKSDKLPDGFVNELVETTDELQQTAENWLHNNTSSGTSPNSINQNEKDRFVTALSAARRETEQTEAATSVFYAIETGIKDGWTAAVAVEQCELVRLRHTPVAREKLDAFLSKG